MLSGLSKLYNYTKDVSFLHAAESLIDSTLASGLVNTSVLVEGCDPSLTCDEDEWMFKGVFMQELGYFLTDVVETQYLEQSQKLQTLAKYDRFIHANAEAVWNVARAPNGTFGNWWGAPPPYRNKLQFGVETMGSGVAALLCAARVDQLSLSLANATQCS